LRSPRKSPNERKKNEKRNKFSGRPPVSDAGAALGERFHLDLGEKRRVGVLISYLLHISPFPFAFIIIFFFNFCSQIYFQSEKRRKCNAAADDDDEVVDCQPTIQDAEEIVCFK